MAFELVAAGDDSERAEPRARRPGWSSLRTSLFRTLALCAMAVLLGRANIEHVISPFALAYLLVLTELFGTRRAWPAWLALVGAYTTGGFGGVGVIAVEFVGYLLLRKGIFRKKAPDLHWLPFLAGLVDTAARLAAVGTVWTRYDLFLAFTEGALTIILSLIFIQCMPMLSGNSQERTFRPEQLVSLTILIGSMMTGLTGVSVYGVPLVTVAVDWMVLIMAAAGGAGMATVTAVVVGVLSMMSHTQSFAAVAVLAFAGLLAGILKEARVVWAALAFVGSTVLLGMGAASSFAIALGSAIAAGIAALLFLFTPGRVRRTLASYVPGTVEHRESEQDRARRVRKILSERVQEMSSVFEELAAAFSESSDSPLMSAQQLLDHTVGRAATTVCKGCPRHAKCWDKEGFATYQAIVHTVEKLESGDSRFASPTPDLKERCVRLDPMMGLLRHNLEMTDRDAKWIEKLREQRTLVSAQLAGVANVIRSVVHEIDRGNESALWGEEQILAALEQLGLFVDHVHIVSLDPGKVEVEITQPTQGAYENSVRMIAPLLSGIVGENITVSRHASAESGPCTSVFTSARLFNIDTAVATVARDGRTVSGDTYTSLDLGNGRYAVAVSDGMGNGERARRESKAAIELLKRLLKAGFDQQLAIQTVNSTLLLRSQDEVFTTLDMALIDLYTAKTEFLKIGSAPSFIKRGDEVIAISGANVPIGILRDIEVQTIDEQLRDGDLLIMVSDGVYDAPRDVYDKEDWLRRQIQRLETADPQSVADTLLEAAVRINHGQIEDDMTVMAAVISAYQPEWASIKLPGVVGIRRDKKRRGA